MTAKQVVEDFYKSNVFLDSQLLETYMHADVSLDWNSSKGFLKMNYEKMVNIVNQMAKAYHSSRIYITHLLEDNNHVTVRYSHFVKTIENPREEMILAHFLVIWEIKDNKLYRGFQMSQLS